MEIRNREKRNSKVSNADLLQKIKALYDHLYANAPIRTPSGIAAEVGKILHIAMFIEETRVGLFLEKEFSQLPAFDYDRLVLKGLLRGEPYICKQVADEVRSRFIEMNLCWSFYEPNTKILLRDSDIAYICAQLNGVLVSDRERDVFGDALEIFRGQWAKRVNGQFFTDPIITSLAMTLLDFDPRRGEDLVDICAGTGGFLLAGLNHIRTLLENDTSMESTEVDLVELAAASIKGQEIDPEVCEIANATLLSRISRVKRPFVKMGDSLQTLEFGESNESSIRYNSHYCIATNPPFGTKITIKDEGLLKQYDLAKNNYGTRNGLNVSNRAPDTLFLEQNIKLLKPGAGRLAIVLPYQILSGPQTFFIRQWLIQHTQIIAVIDLPAETFQPHTGTKTSLLLVKRREKPLKNINEIEDQPIFMSIPRWIGHDRRGNPMYKRLSDGSLGEEIISDFDQVQNAFRLFQRGLEPSDAHAYSFTIPASKILEDSNLRVNALFHKPNIKVINFLTPLSGQKSGWKNVKIRDSVKQIFYPGRFKRNYVDYYPGAVPFLGGSNISQLTVTTDKWLSHDDPKLEELKVTAGWILITRSGSTGIVSTVPKSWDGYAMSEHIIRIVPDSNKLDPAYLYAFLRTHYAQDLLSRGVFGSVIDEITPDFIGSIEIPIPNETELMEYITEKIKNAETSREKAISSLREAVEALDQELAK